MTPEEARDAKRRANRAAYMRKPKPDTSERATRPCIRCRKSRTSAHRGDRYCKSCRDFVGDNSHLAGVSV